MTNGSEHLNLTENSETAAADRPMGNAGDAPAAPAAPPASETDWEELRAKAEKADEYWQRLLRTTADFDNFKKRAARERQEAIKFANEALLAKLVPVLDNFEMAMQAASSAQGAPAQSLQQGVAMIQQQLKAALAEAGLEEIDALGKAFDPAFHEAVGQQETSDAPEGQVVLQLRKGYRLKERLLRPASVMVAKKPAA